MSLPGSWRHGLAQVYALAAGAGTQTTARQPTGFTQGGGTAKIVNAGTVPVFIVFYNFTTAGADPSLTFPVTGGPPTGQPTAGLGILAWTVVPPSTSGATYLDGVGGADSFAVITAATAATVVVQKGEGTGP